jgi:hypothetical protein
MYVAKLLFLDGHCLATSQKSLRKKKKLQVIMFIFESIFWCSQSGNYSQEDLAKFG